MTSDSSSTASNQHHDVDEIIERVRAAVPSVHVEQLNKIYPGDDDGLWWFRLPGVSKDIQIESSSYDCPFLIETEEMCCSDAIDATTVEEVARHVIDYLKSLKPA